MALTRVSRHIIDEPFNPTTVSATDVTTTNINASGIGTVGTLRVTGDLTVEGTTTTLDSVLTEVDRLEVNANSTVAAGIITQTGSGDILRLYDGTTSVFTVADGGKVGLGVVNPNTKLHIKGAGAPGIRLQDEDGTNQYATFIQNNGQLFINSRNDTSRGIIAFRGENDTDTVEFLRIKSDGFIGIGTDNPDNHLHLLSTGGTVAKFESTNATSSLIRFANASGENVYIGASRILMNSLLEQEQVKDFV